MSIRPFFAIDETRALVDLRAVDVAIAGAQRKLLCVDAYCTNPRCPCTEVHLLVCDVTDLLATRGKLEPEELLALARQRWDDGDEDFRLTLDVASRRVEAPPSVRDKARCQDFAKAFEPSLNEELLALIESHRDHALEWRKTNGWRFEDWTDLPEEGGVSWGEVYPASPCFEVEHAGTRYAVDDAYCGIPGCRCRSVFLTILLPGGENGETKAIGALRLDAGESVPRVEQVIQGNSRVVHGVFRSLFDSHTGLLDTLRHRRDVMREFALFVEGQRYLKAARESSIRPSGPLLATAVPLPSGSREDRPMEPRGGLDKPRAKVPRNAPCPCGSGRKYKNCCGGG